MSKLHELLAVESDLKSQAATCVADLKVTFEKKTHHFGEKIVTFKPNTEGAQPKTESQSSLQSTVEKELAWIQEKIAKAVDVGFQVDVANTGAVEDVVLEDGTVLLSDVPVTGLLRIEHRIVEIRDLCQAIPTLDPAKGFEIDVSRGRGIYKAREVSKTRTQKVQRHQVVVPPTKEHPAQVVIVSEDIPVGEVHEMEWSSLITVSAKADILDRVESVLRSVKQARARANDKKIEPADNRIGNKILGYVFTGTLP